MTSDYVIVTIKLCPEDGIDEYIIVVIRGEASEALQPLPPPPHPRTQEATTA